MLTFSNDMQVDWAMARLEKGEVEKAESREDVV
jgi:hypothetical protein